MMIHHLTFINATDYIRKPGNSIANQYGKINNNGRPQATPRYIFSVRLYISTEGAVYKRELYIRDIIYMGNKGKLYT